MTYDDYPVTSKHNYIKALRIFDNVKEKSDYYVYLYSALEFRYCIERLLIEYLYMIKFEPLSDSQEQLYKPNKIVNSILNIDPDFFNKLQFINLFCEAKGLDQRIYCIKQEKFDKIKRIYFKLSEYLHAIKSENLDDYFNELKELLSRAKDELFPIFDKDRGSIQLSERGLEIFEKLKSGEMNYEQSMEILKNEK